MLRRYRRRKHGLCTCCGYDLRVSPTGICPECGTRIWPSFTTTQDLCDADDTVLGPSIPILFFLGVLACPPILWRVTWWLNFLINTPGRCRSAV